VGIAVCFTSVYVAIYVGITLTLMTVGRVVMSGTTILDKETGEYRQNHWWGKFSMSLKGVQLIRIDRDRSGSSESFDVKVITEGGSPPHRIFSFAREQVCSRGIRACQELATHYPRNQG